MKEEHVITVKYRSYDSKSELSEEDQLLLSKAVEYSANAYAPYSEFQVGAAVQLADGKIVAGSNQENAAYPSGLCAERVALFAASANYRDVEMKSIAVYTASETTIGQQISPCGSCRQVMSEYEVKQRANLRVLLMNSGGQIWEFSSCNDLLPLAFDYTALKKK